MRVPDLSNGSHHSCWPHFEPPAPEHSHGNGRDGADGRDRFHRRRQGGPLMPGRGTPMGEKIVVLREFGTEMDAQFAATVLEANGIPARVLADTAGGALPSMALVFPVRLLVRESDAALARELLDTPADPSGEERESR